MGRTNHAGGKRNGGNDGLALVIEDLVVSFCQFSSKSVDIIDKFVMSGYGNEDDGLMVMRMMLTVFGNDNAGDGIW